MSAWTPDELRQVAETDELRVASRRPDGTLRPGVTIWVVPLDDDVYIRSAYGPDNGWFRRALASGTGHVQVGGVDKDIAFTVPDTSSDLHARIDSAYHAKYDRFGPKIVGTVVGPAAAAVTLRLDPVG